MVQCEDSSLSLPGAQVQSLVGELRILEATWHSQKQTNKQKNLLGLESSCFALWKEVLSKEYP